jgi:hypothetical protein
VLATVPIPDQAPPEVKAGGEGFAGDESGTFPIARSASPVDTVAMLQTSTDRTIASSADADVHP